MQETQVRFLGWEDPLEKEMATHSSILSWRISWTEEPCRLLSMGSQRVGHDWGIKPPPPLMGFPGGSDGKESVCNVGDLGSIPGMGRSPGERHGHPLQYSCLENFHGQRTLAGFSPWGCKDSDTTGWLSTAQQPPLIVTMKIKYFRVRR